ncbi:MAG: hypothetical protein AB7P07_02835 [Hyphomonadaceae bacterium]
MRVSRRATIVLGVAAYLGCLALFFLAVAQDGGASGFSHGRIRGATSDIGMLLTALAAGPIVILAAIANWNKK